MFIAHAGASDKAPENTIAAFNLAWKEDADGIEGDYHLTKDTKIACIHDDTTERTGKQRMRVAETTFAKLRQLDVGSWKGDRWRGTRIPSLQKVLATVPKGKKVFIEMKCGPEIIPALTHALAKSKLQPEQIAIISFHTEVIAEAKRQIPEMKALWLTSFSPGKTTGAVAPSPKEIVATLEKIGADGVGCQFHASLNKRFMRTLRAAHKEVHVWTVDDVATANRLVQLGVDSITSNRAGWLKRQIREKQKG
ncbi:MAG: glycerophosphodiester phosphodiesterase [Verrucomicrobiae bacterium]